MSDQRPVRPSGLPTFFLNSVPLSYWITLGFIASHVHTRFLSWFSLQLGTLLIYWRDFELVNGRWSNNLAWISFRLEMVVAWRLSWKRSSLKINQSMWGIQSAPFVKVLLTKALFSVGFLGQPVRPGVPPTQRPPGPGPQQRPQGPPGSGPQQRPQGPPGSGPQQRPQGPPGSGPQQRPQGPPGSGPPQRPQGPVMPQPGQPQQRPSGPPQRPSCPTQRPVGPPGQDQPSQRPARPARPQTPQGLQGSRFPNGSGGGRMPTVGIPPRSQRVSPVLTAAVAAAGPPQRETGASKYFNLFSISFLIRWY